MQLTNSIVARFLLFVLLAALVLAVQSSLASGQLAREVREPDVARLRQIVTGRVSMPDGSPAVGAVVVTSAGGQAVTGADGSFTLAVELSPDTGSVEVTAVAAVASGMGSMVARASVVPAALSPTTSVGLLSLTLSTECHPRWLPTFGGLPVVDDDVLALAIHDDGSGPALYVGGSFLPAGGGAANGVVKWDGSHWSAVGTINGVRTLAVHDDGSGAALYANGGLGVVKWDGSSWSSLPGGTGDVHALLAHDDGNGPALYAAGLHPRAGPGFNGILEWNGTSWSMPGNGVNRAASCLAVYDDGSGPALYVGGEFTHASGVLVNGIAKWDGSTWSALGAGVTSLASVDSLAVFDDGSGPALHAGGEFTTAGGISANHIAKWDGSSWSALGSGLSNGSFMTVGALAEFDDGSGPALYAGGEFLSAGGVPASHIARWNGSSWSAVDGGRNGVVHALLVHDDGTGPALYAGADFVDSGFSCLRPTPISRWNGSSWSSNWSLVDAGLDDSVLALTVFDDGSGSALFAGGTFTSAGDVAVSRIAKWNGTSWSPLGAGVQGDCPAVVYALAVFDDGSGPALYVGGRFTSAGALTANGIAKWDGSSWSVLGTGVNGAVETLAVFDDGGGAALYAGGLFTTAGGVPVNRIARWDGTTWSALGSGVTYSPSPSLATVTALAVFDGGSGAALYAGGLFTTAGGVPANHVAQWNGSTWSALGSGTDDQVLALAVFDDGSGGALYAGGSFATAGGVTADRIARWDGSSWSGLASGFTGPDVRALIVHDDGHGAALHAGGKIGKRVAKWDGSSWTTIGLGLNGSVDALASWDDGHGPALFAGGEFTLSPRGDSHLAKWGCSGNPKAKRRKL